jgi:hypothetical protein
MTIKHWVKFLVLTAIMAISSFVIAATTDFTANSDLTVTGVTFGVTTADMLILNGSTAESFGFDAGAFTVTNPGSFQVGSSDVAVKTIRAAQGASTVACTINTTPGTSYLTVPTVAGIYTITPSVLTTCQDQCSAISNAATLNAYPTCGVASCNSGYSLLGSGASATCIVTPNSGGGSGSSPTPPAVAPVVPPNFLLPLIPTSRLYLPLNSPANPIFTRPLFLNRRGEDVRNLQRFLNANPDTRIALTGVGSPGNETDFFGGLTKAALGKFQLKYGLVFSLNDPTFGYLGPKTRAKIAELAAAPIPSVPSQSQALQQLRQLLQMRLMGR